MRFSNSRMLVMAGCITIGTLLINTNIMFSVKNIIRKERLRDLVHDELVNFMKKRSYLSIPLNVKENIVKQKQIVSNEMTMVVNQGVKLTTKQDDIDSIPFLFERNFTPAYILGQGRNRSTSIVIGVPSVKRTGGGYLYETLTSLFKNMYPISEEKVTVVVFLAETNMEFVKTEANRMYRNFTREINNGLLQIISPPENFYPDFNRLEQTLGDPADRVRWRSKEVFDAAYLMFVCRNKATYYLMLEDDVVPVKGYITAILEFAASYENKEYLFLSFSTFYSIANLFRAKDIPTWASYLFSEYRKMPIDWLMMDWVRMKACKGAMTSEKCSQAQEVLVPQVQRGYFQHIGSISSLEGKEQLISDNLFFPSAVAANPHTNPPAKVTTSMETVNSSNVRLWYLDGGEMNQHFYVGSSKKDSDVTITFNTPQIINKILVKARSKDGNIGTLIAKSPIVIEVLPVAKMWLSQTQFDQCAEIDTNGAAECHLNYKISMFRIRLTPTLTSVWFDLVYVN